VDRLEDCSYFLFHATKVYGCAGKNLGPSARVRYRLVRACNCASLSFVLINVLSSYAVTTIKSVFGYFFHYVK
jgi:hypothetical protein